MVALALDLTLRSGTDNRVSLDDVMRCLWQEFGAPVAASRKATSAASPRNVPASGSALLPHGH